MSLEEIRDESHPSILPILHVVISCIPVVASLDYPSDAADTQALDLHSIVSHRWSIHPCSAMTGTGLDVGLDWMVKEVAGRLYWSGLAPTTISSSDALDPNAPPLRVPV